MSYHHLTISERIRIEVLSILGYSTRFIAKFLHRHHSTIARELSRNKIKNEYVSISAHNNYLKRRKNSSHSYVNLFVIKDVKYLQIMQILAIMPLKSNIIMD